MTDPSSGARAALEQLEHKWSEEYIIGVPWRRMLSDVEAALAAVPAQPSADEITRLWSTAIVQARQTERPDVQVFAELLLGTAVQAPPEHDAQCEAEQPALPVTGYTACGCAERAAVPAQAAQEPANSGGVDSCGCTYHNGVKLPCDKHHAAVPPAEPAPNEKLADFKAAVARMDRVVTGTPECASAGRDEAGAVPDVHAKPAEHMRASSLQADGSWICSDNGQYVKHTGGATCEICESFRKAPAPAEGPLHKSDCAKHGDEEHDVTPWKTCDCGAVKPANSTRTEPYTAVIERIATRAESGAFPSGQIEFEIAELVGRAIGETQQNLKCLDCGKRLVCPDAPAEGPQAEEGREQVSVALGQVDAIAETVQAPSTHAKGPRDIRGPSGCPADETAGVVSRRSPVVAEMGEKCPICGRAARGGIITDDLRFTLICGPCCDEIADLLGRSRAVRRAEQAESRLRELEQANASLHLELQGHVALYGSVQRTRCRARAM